MKEPLPSQKKQDVIEILARRNSKKTGKWTETQTKRLIELMIKFDGDYEKVHHGMPDKSLGAIVTHAYRCRKKLKMSSLPTATC